MSPVWSTIALAILLPVLVAAGLHGAGVGLHGLRGGRILVPQRRGEPFEATGWSARLHGAFFLLLGVVAVGAGLWGLGALVRAVFWPVGAHTAA